MQELFAAILVALVVFTATNVDNFLVLAVFLADPAMRTRSVLLGQFLGNGTLVIVSILAGLLALAVHPQWIALLGIVPVFLGIRGMVKICQRRPAPDPAAAPQQERQVQSKVHSQTLAVALVTIAIGGDNLGIYIPLFARSPGKIPTYIVVYVILMVLSCFASHRLAKNSILARHISRYGHLILPFVLLGVGLYILWGARSLLMP